MLYITCTISLVFLSVIFADTVDRVSDADEIFRRLDGLAKRVGILESENIQLKKELKNQSDSFVDLKSQNEGKYKDLNRKQLKLKDEIKVIRYQKLARVEAALLDSKNELKALETKIGTKNRELENKIDVDVNKVKDSLNDTKVTLQESTRNQNEKLVQHQKSLQSLQNTVSALNSTRKMDGTLPSFYALLSSTVPIRGGNQIIIYDKTGTNNGNAYNTSSGIFTVPESGVYVFTWTAFSYVEEYVRLEIVVAGTIFGGTLSDTQESGDADTETGIIVANVKAGDKVFIRTQSRGPGDGRLYVEFECTSTFSGWKIS